MSLLTLVFITVIYASYVSCNAQNKENSKLEIFKEKKELNFNSRGKEANLS